MLTHQTLHAPRRHILGRMTPRGTVQVCLLCMECVWVESRVGTCCVQRVTNARLQEEPNRLHAEAIITPPPPRLDMCCVI